VYPLRDRAVAVTRTVESDAGVATVRPCSPLAVSVGTVAGGRLAVVVVSLPDWADAPGAESAAYTRHPTAMVTDRFIDGAV
jgi:tRNA(Met) C34 N-acetyltransferase TmcA